MMIRDSHDRVGAAFANHDTIEPEIGRGGMARLLLARNIRHNRAIDLTALFYYPTESLDRDHFVREIRSILCHPRSQPHGSSHR
jgi:hypothetical protein